MTSTFYDRLTQRMHTRGSGAAKGIVLSKNYARLQEFDHQNHSTIATMKKFLKHKKLQKNANDRFKWAHVVDL